MRAEEFIKQQITTGHEIHFNKGIWWQRIAPFFYKPVVQFQETMPGKSAPAFFKSLSGYSHLVSDKKLANKYWSVMLLDHEKKKEFTIKSLSSSKRAQVRKGLRLTEIKKIENIEPVIEDIKNICISQARRTLHGLPPEYYIKHYKKWRIWITKEFNLPKREWWGSFYQGSLIAYNYSVQVDDAMAIYTAKSHTDFLDKCPNDALVYTFLDYCKSLDNCKKIIYGEWSREAGSLNEFKRKYGFERVDFPVYAKYNPLVLLCKKGASRLSRKTS